MSNAPSQSSPLAQPPHIRLNSGSKKEVPTLASLSNKASGPMRQDMPIGGRSLVPQRPGTTGTIREQPPPSPGTPTFYGAGSAPSAEHLLAPSRSRTRRFRDDDSYSAVGSPVPSGYSSRRTSWSSERSRESRIYSSNPFDDSRAPSRAGSEDDNVNTQTVSEKYNILPSAGLLLFPEDVEKDDYLHNPDPNERDARECDFFTKRGLVNLGGLALITAGILTLFIGYPILYVPTLHSRVHVGLANSKLPEHLCVHSRSTTILAKAILIASEPERSICSRILEGVS